MLELHKLMIRYRVVYLMVIIFFLWLGYDAWTWYKANHKEMTEWAMGGFITIFGSVIGALKYAMENALKNNEHD